MFTGLIERVGTLRERVRSRDGWALEIDHEPWDLPLREGESVAVQGVCLTVARLTSRWFRCDVLAETLERTNLESKSTGSLLNLERALRVGDRLGGHLVSGHVDGTGLVLQSGTEGADRVLRVQCADGLEQGIIVKGSIAIDGVSLTVTAVEGSTFDVHIIPFTWGHTSLTSLSAGATVNLETDLIGKYVARHMDVRSGTRPLAVDDLMRAGFV